MLVVITIIGLIMGLIGPRVLNYLSESKVKAAKIQLQSFGSALDLFYLDAGRFPSTAEGLTALVRPTPGVASWNGPYLRGGNVPNDPWNHSYLYRSPGEHGPYDIMSYGSDGQEGGSAYIRAALGLVAGVFSALLLAVPQISHEPNLPPELKIETKQEEKMRNDRIKESIPPALFAAFISGFLLDQFYLKLSHLEVKDVELKA